MPSESPSSNQQDPSKSEPLNAQWWGRIYGEFQWGDVVCGGGNELLYRGTFGSAQQRCFLLPLRRESFPTPEHLARFEAGMAAVQQLVHPGLLRILGVGVRDGTACICYEDFAGEPLINLIPRQPKANYAVAVVSTIARGLQVAHLQGICHWDVNTAWILADPKAEAKLVGLGVAALVYPTKRQFYEATLRRPASMRSYIAPEQLQEESETPVSPQTDIYSLGAISYHLLTGAPIGGYIVLPSSRREVGTFTDDVVFTATLADPRARQQTAEKFAEDICRIGGGVDNSHYELSDASEKQRVMQARRERQRNLMLAGCGLAAIGLGVFFTLHKPNESAEPVETTSSESAPVSQASQVGGLISKGQKEAAMALVSVAMQKLVALDWTKEKTDELEEMAPLAVELGQEDNLLANLNRLSQELPPDSPDLARVGQLVSLLSEGTKNHHEAMAAAKRYRTGGQKEQSRLELARAQAYLPNHPDTLAALKELDYDYLPVMKGVLSEAKLSDGQPVQFGVREQGLELHVDLANNPELKDISFLRGHAITHLDISNTAVSDLEPLASLPLQLLHADDTEVKDLRPLRGSSLRMLTAEGVEIEQKGLVGQSVFLTNYRIGLPFSRSMTKTDRVRPKREWINALGMRFSPLRGSETVLFGDWETRLGDFEAFATEVKLTVSPGMMARDADGQWKVQPHSWSDPVGEQGAEDPVAGVTFGEAKRFCEWLTRRALEKEFIPRGAKFRLPTSKEWSQATGLLDEPKEGVASAEGPSAIYPWGAEWPPPLTAGNYPDIPSADGKPRTARKYPYTSPVGRFRNLCPHRDMGGNLREWCVNEAQEPVLRDASCLNDQRDFPKLEEALKLTAETKMPSDSRDATVGFRVLLDLAPVTPVAKPASASPASPP